jgi:hypothetical protein
MELDAPNSSDDILRYSNRPNHLGWGFLNGPGGTRTDIDSGPETKISGHRSAESGARFPCTKQWDPRLLEVIEVWDQVSEHAKRLIGALIREK